LVPRIDESYRTLAEARARASIGGGHIGSTAVELGFRYPELFRRVAAQSPLMDPDSISDLRERGADVRPMVVYLDWGSYHMRSPHEAWSLVDSMRELWKVLHEAGYRPAGGERPEGFGWPIWAAHTDELLAALFPLER
jgi:enterochelin esterase-like enzyme